MFNLLITILISYFFQVISFNNETKALYDLYTLTDGKNWAWKDEATYGPKWNFTTLNPNPCNTNGKVWQGIICTQSSSFCFINNITYENNCNIISIILTKYGLKGKLSNNLYLLNKLTKLDLTESSLKGTIPETMGKLTNLQSLLLQYNSLSKTIPSSLSALTLATNLKLASNRLTGNIPTFLSNLQSLISLLLDHNSFTGTIPNEITYFSKLQYLHIQNNLLTGTIPSSISSLKNMLYLYFNANYLNGTIPSTLGLLTNMYIFSFDNNMLTGPIPKEIGSLAKLQYLYLHYNSLSNTLPTTLGSLNSLLFFAVDHNSLTGPIPKTLGLLSQLQYLYVRYNSLSKSIPTELCYLTKLKTLSIHANDLTYTIPSCIGDMSNLQYFSAYYNYLSQTIPTSLGKLSNLLSIALEANELTGTIPSELGYNKKMNYIVFSLNNLHGTIPSSIISLPLLQVLNFRLNHLTGTIPTEIGLASILLSLSLQSNYLTGTIPSQIGSITTLTELYLQSNHLDDGFQDLFWQPTKLKLVILDVSNNILYSTIPKNLFYIPKLEIIALTSNCFYGTLPRSICSAKSAKVFYMDGLGLADNCLQNKLTFPFTDVVIINPMEGTLPKCLWNLTKLQVLSLSGNELSGSLHNIPLNSKLINLTLSHNHLSGSIPLSMQIWPFQLIDLSYNKFYGTLEKLTIPSNYTSQYSNYSQIILTVNRLSGILPDNFKKYHNLDILEGNIFSCNNIPTNDKTSNTYICGSREFDQSMIVLTSLLCTIIILLIIFRIYYKLKDESSLIKNQVDRIYRYITCSAIDISQLPRLYYFSKALESVAKISLMMMIIGIIFCFPIYILKLINKGDDTPQYSTHTYLYRWIWTIAYTTGETIAILILITWAISILAFVALLSFWLGNDNLGSNYNSPITSNDNNSSTNSSIDIVEKFIMNLTLITEFTFLDGIKLFLLAFINTVVVGGVNILYIYASFNDLSPTNHALIQLLMGMFKYLWNFICVPWLILGPLKNTRYKAGLRLALMLINSIWLPCIVTALTSPACFQSLIVPPPKIKSYYSYVTCNLLLNGECIEYETVSIELLPLSPAFSYDHLCASSVITAYLPVYLYTYCFLIIIPIIYTYILITQINYETLPNRLRSSLHGVIYPNIWRQTDVTRITDINSLYANSEVNKNKNNNNINNNGNDNDNDSLYNRYNSTSVIYDLPSPERLLNVQTIVATLMHHITVLLTFGLCCPLLAFIITCAICVSVLQWRYLVGRFVSSRIITRNSVRFIDGIPKVVDSVILSLEFSVGRSLDYFRATLWPVLWTSCIFFVFLGWDMAGDEVGWKHGLWAPCTTIFFSIIIWFIMRVKKHRKWTSRFNSWILSFDDGYKDNDNINKDGNNSNNNNNNNNTYNSGGNNNNNRYLSTIDNEILHKQQQQQQQHYYGFNFNNIINSKNNNNSNNNINNTNNTNNNNNLNTNTNINTINIHTDNEFSQRYSERNSERNSERSSDVQMTPSKSFIPKISFNNNVNPTTTTNNNNINKSSFNSKQSFNSSNGRQTSVQDHDINDEVVSSLHNNNQNNSSSI